MAGSRTWTADDRTGGAVDEILNGVRTALPGVDVERLAATWPTDDDNVYWLAYLEVEVQVDTHPGGGLPVLIQAGDRQREAGSVETAIECIVDELRGGGSLRLRRKHMHEEAGPGHPSNLQERAGRPDAVELCFVCGLDCVAAGIGKPWGETGLDPSFDYCPCCGTEFGYQDSTLDAARATRERWLDAGGTWSDPTHPQPDGWTAAAQLDALPERAQ